MPIRGEDRVPKMANRQVQTLRRMLDAGADTALTPDEILAEKVLEVLGRGPLNFHQLHYFAGSPNPAQLARVLDRMAMRNQVAGPQGFTTEWRKLDMPKPLVGEPSICRKCGKTLTEENQTKSSRERNNRTCRDCDNTYYRDWYEKRHGKGTPQKSIERPSTSESAANTAPNPPPPPEPSVPVPVPSFLKRLWRGFR